MRHRRVTAEVVKAMDIQLEGVSAALEGMNA
jgi:hypothetical protein